MEPIVQMLLGLSAVFGVVVVLLVWGLNQPLDSDDWRGKTRYRLSHGRFTSPRMQSIYYRLLRN